MKRTDHDAGGDVLGPSVAILNGIPVFKDTSGVEIRTTNVVIDASDNMSALNNLTMEGVLTIDVDNEEAFLLRQNGDGGDVVKFSTISPTSTSGSYVGFDYLVNAFAGYAGGAKNATFVRTRSDISSGNQSRRVRAFDGLVRYSGDAIHSGTVGNQIRVWNGSIAWNSTGTCSDMTGMKNFLAAGGGGGVTSGLIALAVGNQSKIGFNPNDAGSFTTGICFFAEGPSGTDATHTIGTSVGLRVGDHSPVGVATGIAIEILDQTVGCAIKTGIGKADFGDEVFAFGKVNMVKYALMRD